MKLLVSVKNSAEMLSVSSTKLNGLINEGRLHAIKVGRRTLITMDSLHQLIENAPICGGALTPEPGTAPPLLLSPGKHEQRFDRSPRVKG